MPNFKSEAVRASRFLSWPAAVALGAGLSLAIQLALVETLLRTTGPWVYAFAWIFYLPLLLAWLDLPDELGPFDLRRLAGYPRLGFSVAWIELGGFCVLAALLAEGAAMGLTAGSVWLWQIDLQPEGLLALVIGAVAINELIGTRAHSHAASIWVAMMGVLFVALVFSSEMIFSSEMALGNPMLENLLPTGDVHQLLAPALLASVLWGPLLFLSRRRLMRRSQSPLLPIAVLWLLLPLVGAVGLWIGIRHPEMTASGILNQGSLNLSGSQPESVLLGLIALGVGVALCLLGLSQVLAAAIRLSSSMSLSGMLPKGLISQRSERGIPLIPLMTLALASWGTASGSSIEHLAAGAALAILWLAPLSLWPHIRRPSRPGTNDLGEAEGEEQTPASREARLRLALPFHPLIPMLVSAGCLFLSLVLPRSVLGTGAVWIAMGALYFILHGRRGLAEIGLKKYVVGSLPSQEEQGLPRVMVTVGGGPTQSTLIQVGSCLATQQGGELLVLHVEPSIEQSPWSEARMSAERALETLINDLEQINLPDGLTVRPLVRVAPTIADGILAAASEMKASFIVLGWPVSRQSFEHEPVVERVFAATSLAMAVVHGLLPTKIDKVMVASAGGPHAPIALELAEALAAQTNASETSILNVVTPGPAMAEGQEAIRQTLEKRVGTAADIRELVIEAPTAASGIERAAGLQDIVLLGASMDRLLGQTRLGGFPTLIATGRRGMTIVVKRREAAPRFIGRRLWEWVSNPLPPLSDEQRVKVQLAMRNAARADIDFYMLISLAAAIATLGLMQSSAAVVIGAMLVAPLMSPILGMAHAMACGHLRLVRRASSSTLKGVGIAIAVGSVIPLIFPGISPTPEILSRGAPSLLDLAVALASGAAAAYAVSRPSVAAALPGVAISAALVPPLCVVGFGLGASELPLAGGALLLFTTNLCAIVSAAAVVFLMMGFRPRRAHRGDKVWTSLGLALLGLMMVSIPLGFETRDMLRSSKIHRSIKDRLGAASDSSYVVDEVQFVRHEGTLRVRVEVRSFVADLPLERFEIVRRDLAAEIGDEEFELDLVISQAQRVVIGGSRE